MKHLTYIEPLEDRIAPATIINPYTVTYQDTNSNTVVVTISKPLFTLALAKRILVFTDSNNNQITESFTGNSTPENLALMNLLLQKGINAQDMNISVKTLPKIGTGTGQVNVGSIEAANFDPSNGTITQNVDLGSVYIQGNLGSIVAGDNIVSTPGLKSLNVESMTTPANSYVLGPIAKMNVQGNFNANLHVIGYQFGTIDNLTIGGSLTGDSAGDTNTGEIQFQGHIGTATIGNITGTAANNTGEIFGNTSTNSRIGSLHVLGSITGGSGGDSGLVFAQSSIGKLTVDGSIIGGAGQFTGLVQGPIGTAKITGSVTGGAGADSGGLFGQIFSGAQTANVGIGTVTIGGDLTGGSAGTAASGTTAAVPGNTGVIIAASAKSIQIGGSIIGGAPTSSTTADTSGAILVDTVSAIAVGGKIVGGGGPNSGVITIADSLAAGKFGSISVGGDITGGSGTTSGSIELTSTVGATLGTLRIGGSLIGGTANGTGEVHVNGALTTAVISGGVTGNQSINSSTGVLGSGDILATGISSLNIHGNVTAGLNSGSGGIANSGAIRSSLNIGSLVIGGDIVGTAADPVYISATQGTVHKSTLDVALGTVSIAGNATYLDLLAGYGPGSVAVPLGGQENGSAQIGTVTIMGNMAASNIVAGVQPDANGDFGTTGNTLISNKVNHNAIARIADVIIDGTATGNDATPSDTFGIVASDLGVVTVQGGANLALGLTPGTPRQVDSTNLYLLDVS